MVFHWKMDIYTSYLFNIPDIDVFLGLGDMPDYADIKREDNLRVGWNHTVFQLWWSVYIKQSSGQFSYTVPLPVHEKAASVSMDESTESLQDFEDHLLHINILLHVFDQIKEYRSFLHLTHLFKRVQIHFGLWDSRYGCHSSSFELFFKVSLCKLQVSIKKLLHIFAFDAHLCFAPQEVQTRFKSGLDFQFQKAIFYNS